MKWRNVVVLSAVALLSFGCAPSRAQPGNSLHSEFVGSTPCNALLRDFLKIPSNDACECIRWQLTLHAGDGGGSRGTYMLVTTYGMSETNAQGFFQGGTKAETTGKWKTTVGPRAN